MKYERDVNGWFPGARADAERAAPCGYCPAPTCGFDRPTHNIGCRGADCARFTAWAEANPAEYQAYAADVEARHVALKRKMRADYARALGLN